MATIYGQIKGVKFLRETSGGGTSVGFAVVTFTMPVYTASTDNGQLGGGGYDRDVATTDTLQTILQKQRRDGKTVTLQNSTNGAATLLSAGAQGATEYFAGSYAVSGGNLTFNVTNSAGTEIDAASGVSDRPIVVGVSYTLT